MDILRMQRKTVRGLTPYNPGILAKYRYKLDANESGYDVPAGAKKLIMKRIAATAFNRYPDPGAAELRSLLAKKHRVTEKNIVVGNGSDELIHYLIQAFTDPGDRVVSPVPSFDMYRILALANGAKPVCLPLTDTLNLDDRAVLKAAKRAKFIFIAYPNNPTGNCFSEEKIGNIIRKAKCFVVLDEAYYEFSKKSFLPMLKKHKNLIILRTFSKAYSMAALRLGFMIAHPDVVDAVNKVRLPYNINALTQACACVMMKFDISGTVDGIIEERERMYGILKGMYPTVKSDANFLLLKPASIKKAKIVFEKSGISIRMFGAGVLSGWMRVTVGTPEENAAVMKILLRGV